MIVPFLWIVECVSTEKEERDSEHFQWRTRQNTEKIKSVFGVLGFSRERERLKKIGFSL